MFFRGVLDLARCVAEVIELPRLGGDSRFVLAIDEPVPRTEAPCSFVCHSDVACLRPAYWNATGIGDGQLTGQAHHRMTSLMISGALALGGVKVESPPLLALL